MIPAISSVVPVKNSILVQGVMWRAKDQLNPEFKKGRSVEIMDLGSNQKTIIIRETRVSQIFEKFQAHLNVFQIYEVRFIDRMLVCHSFKLQAEADLNPTFDVGHRILVLCTHTPNQYQVKIEGTDVKQLFSLYREPEAESKTTLTASSASIEEPEPIAAESSTSTASDAQATVAPKEEPVPTAVAAATSAATERNETETAREESVPPAAAAATERNETETVREESVPTAAAAATSATTERNETAASREGPVPTATSSAIETSDSVASKEKPAVRTPVFATLSSETNDLLVSKEEPIVPFSAPKVNPEKPKAAKKPGKPVKPSNFFTSFAKSVRNFFRWIISFFR